MEAIKLTFLKADKEHTYFYTSGIAVQGEYYPKPESDAEIARLQADLFQAQAKSSRLEARCGDLQDDVANRDHQIEVLNADLTRCQDSKAEYGDKILRLEGEVERLNRELKMCNRSRKWWKELAYEAGAEKISCRAATIKQNEALSGGR